jgi:uncharacterized protein YaiI (UPF0178 family)
MQILVDADACPVKDEVMEQAAAYSIRAIFFSSLAHSLARLEGAEIVRVDKEAESVDLAIANATRRGDIVVTQDYGLASIVLGRGAHAISPRGRLFSAKNIDALLFERHIGKKIRRAGGKTKGPRAFSRIDRECFRAHLDQLIRTSLSGECSADQ